MASSRPRSPLVGRPRWPRGDRLDGSRAVRLSDGSSVLGGGVGAMSSDPGRVWMDLCWERGMGSCGSQVPPPLPARNGSCPMRASFPLTCLHEDPASKYRTSENTLQSMINSEEEAGGRVGVTCPAKELKLHPWGQHPKSAPQSVVRPPPGSHSRPVLSTHGTDTTWDSTQTCRTQGCARGPEN